MTPSDRRSAAVNLEPYLKPGAEQEGVRALSALTQLGLKVHAWVPQGSKDWYVRFLPGAAQVKYVLGRPDGMDLYFDPTCVGWPGWQTALALVVADAMGVPENMRPTCRCIEKDAAMREARQHALSLERHLATTLSAEEAKRSAVRNLEEECLALRRSIDDLPVATPDVAEELMMEDNAGRLLTIRQHGELLSTFDNIIMRLSRMQLGMGSNPTVKRDLQLIQQYLNPKGPFNGSEA